MIYENVAEDANIIFGAVVDEKLKDQVSITVLATGFSLNPNAADGDQLDDLLTTLDQQLSAPRPKVRPSLRPSLFDPSLPTSCRVLSLVRVWIASAHRALFLFLLLKPNQTEQQAFSPPPPPPAQQALPPMYEESYVDSAAASSNAGAGKGPNDAGMGGNSGGSGKKGMGGFFKMFRRS